METKQEVAHRGYPLDISPRVAGELTQLHNVAGSRRMEHYDWTLDLPPDADRRTKDYR